MLDICIELSDICYWK